MKRLKPLHVHGHKLVLAHAKAVPVSSFHCVDAVTGVHALDEGGLAGILRVHNRVVAGLVQSHGIRGGKDAEIGGLESQSQSTESLLATLM